MALQPWSGGHGFLFVFDQSSGGTSSIRLQGLDPTATYQLTDVRTGTVVGQEKGAALESGLDVTLSQPYSALVLELDPVPA